MQFYDGHDVMGIPLASIQFNILWYLKLHTGLYTVSYVDWLRSENNKQIKMIIEEFLNILHWSFFRANAPNNGVDIPEAQQLNGERDPRNAGY